MPKIVDHDERRRSIADAYAIVVRRDGMAAASVRTVAAEAGLSAGAMRHYFDSQTGLVRFVAEDLTRRLTARIDELAAKDVDPVLLLEELIPLDAQRRADFDVWLALVVSGLQNPELADISAQAHAGIRRVCHRVLAAYGVRRSEDRARRLHAFVDGISLHLSLYPDDTSVVAARRSLREQVRALTAG